MSKKPKRNEAQAVEAGAEEGAQAGVEAPATETDPGPQTADEAEAPPAGEAGEQLAAPESQAGDDAIDGESLYEFFSGLAAGLENHPQGAQGSFVYPEPIALPEGTHLDDANWSVLGGRWQFRIEDGHVLSATRKDQTHLWRRGSSKIEPPDAA